MMTFLLILNLVDESDEEAEEIYNSYLKIQLLNDESDPENNLPLSVIQDNLKSAPTSRNWSINSVPYKTQKMLMHKQASTYVKNEVLIH